MAWLYRYETKGIQSWILNSNKLRDLAGGSALVESLTQAARESVGIGTEIVQATSGAMTAVFPNRASLEAFASEWPMQFAHRAPGLQMIHAWVEEKDGLTALFDRLVICHNDQRVVELELNPWVLRSGRSGLAAVPHPSDIRSISRQTVLDPVAVAKERAHKAALGQKSEVTGGRDWAEFEENLDHWSDGPVAVIHADGSGIGQKLLGLGHDIKALKAFSKALKQACEASIRCAVDGLEPRNGKLEARPVVSAGDDLTYIVAADQARRFAENWLKTFEEVTEAHKADLGGSKLFGGVGIAIVNRSYPFSRAYAISERLCSKAKDELKKAGRKSSVLAFERITTSLLGDESHSSAWVVESSTGTQRLEQLVSAVRDLPRGTLRTWLNRFQRGDSAVAGQLWARAGEVARNERWMRFASALDAVGADPRTGAFLQGRSDPPAIPLGGYERSTPVSDALTLRFVEEAK